MASQGYGLIVIVFLFVGMLMIGMLIASGALENKRSQIYPYRMGGAVADPYVGETVQEIVEQSDNPILLVHVDAVSSLPPHYFTEFQVFVVDN